MAEQRKCNWKTDLILIESFYELVEDGSFVPTVIPDDSINFKIVYRCVPDKRYYTAERQNGIYRGCKKVDDNNLAVFLPLSRHSLGRGLLSRELFLSTPDNNFDHGVRNICIPAYTGVILSEGPSDGDASPVTTIIAERLLKGDKGDPGPKGDTPLITADEKGNIYSDGELVTGVVAKAAAKAGTSAENADKQAGRAKALADHPPKIVDVEGLKYWAFWDETSKAYVTSEYRAEGGAIMPIFWVDPETLIAYVTYQNGYEGAKFKLENGILYAITTVEE